MPLFALPPVLAWETDVMARATVEQSLVTGASSGAGGTALALTAAETHGLLALRDRRASFLFTGAGRYGQSLSMLGGAMPPRDIAGSFSARGDLLTSPRTVVSLGADGSLASRLGLRAMSDLAMRDPFLRNRVVYGLNSRIAITGVTSKRDTVRADVGYARMGAIAAEVPEAVGLDSQTVRASLGLTHEIDPRTLAGPVARGSVTHHEHALLDTDLRRGKADVMSLSALGAATRAFTSWLDGSLSLGVTVASPPPILKGASAGMAPDVRIGATWKGHRSRAVAGYAYAYESLGPRIGFGYDHTATLAWYGRPLDGRQHREMLCHAILQFRHGTAPLAASPKLGLLPGAPPSEGQLATTAAAAGVGVDVPVIKGLILLGRLDLEVVSARVTPAPSTGEPVPVVRTIFTLGLSAIGATDPRRRVPRAPGEDDTEAGVDALLEEADGATEGKPAREPRPRRDDEDENQPRDDRER